MLGNVYCKEIVAAKKPRLLFFFKWSLRAVSCIFEKWSSHADLRHFSKNLRLFELRYMIKSVAAIFFYSAPAESTNDK